MPTLHYILTAPQRAAALAAVDTYRGNDFMGWRAESEFALRTPVALHNSQALRSLFSDLGGLANLCERNDGHRLAIGQPWPPSAGVLGPPSLRPMGTRLIGTPEASTEGAPAPSLLPSPRQPPSTCNRDP